MYKKMLRWSRDKIKNVFKSVRLINYSNTFKGRI